MNSILRRRRAAMGGKKGRQPVFLDSVKFWDLSGQYGIQTDGKAVQGGTHYGSSIYYIVISADESEQYLYTTNESALTTTLRNTYTTLGHANSMTCDQDGTLYVATGDATKGVAIIAISGYSQTGSIQLLDQNGDPYSPWSIAYDVKRNLLYSRVGNETVNVHHIDGSFVASRHLSQATSGTNQGMETDGEFLYLETSSPNQILVYDLTGKFIKSVSVGTSYEFEELVYDWKGGFWGVEFRSNGRQQVYAILLRDFEGQFRMSYTPTGAWTLSQSAGTINRSGYFNLQFASTGAKNYNLVARANGYPFSYTEIAGKKCSIEFDLERGSGAYGSVLVSVFTANTQSAGANDRIYQKTKTFTIPASGSTHVLYEFVPGGDWFAPSSTEYGNYVGFWIFLYAESGNSCWVRNFRFNAEVSA